MHIATIDTRHFSFMSLGETDADARDALMKGWAIHCEDTGADPDHISPEDLNVTELEVGDCARDYNVICRQPKQQ